MESCPLSSVMMTKIETTRFEVEEQRVEYLKNIVKPNWKKIFSQTVRDAINFIDEHKLHAAHPKETIVSFKVTLPDGETKTFSKKHGEMIVIGTLENCDILLSRLKPGLSRGHAFIGIGLEDIVVCDLGSLYGFETMSTKDVCFKHSLKLDGGRLTRRFGIDERSFVLKINGLLFLFEFGTDLVFPEHKVNFLTEVDSLCIA
jgi:hypothetical protein